MASPLLSDSLGHTPAKKSERIGHTTRFYGVSFLKGKLQDNESIDDGENFCHGRNLLFDTYGVLLCMLLVFSILIVTLGLALALAGHFTPKKIIKTTEILKHKTAHDEVLKALRYNRMLNTFVMAGMVLLAIGISLFIVLMVIPFCSSYDVTIKKKNEYYLAPTSDNEEDIIINKIAPSDCESIVMETTSESPVSQFKMIHQQLKPTDVEKSLIK